MAAPAKRTAQRAVPVSKPAVNPGDVTGLKSQKLAADAEAAAEQERAAENLTMLTKKRRVQTETYDLTGDEAQIQVGEELVDDVDETDPNQTIECVLKRPLEQMAFGRIVTEPGRWEKVTDEDGHSSRHWIPPILGNIRFFSVPEGAKVNLPYEMYLWLDERDFIRH